VLPFVNKALALFQWKQDAIAAEELCRQALEIDPECDVAIATLAQLSLQQGKIQEAIGWFEKSAKCARTEGELIGALTCEFFRGLLQRCVLGVSVRKAETVWMLSQTN
jgi:import receptor subunit TOM70